MSFSRTLASASLARGGLPRRTLSLSRSREEQRVQPRAVEVTLTSLARVSFAENGWLYGWNLFLMTAGVAIGLLMVGHQVQLIVRDQHTDHPLKPVTIWRAIQALACLSFTLRRAVEADYLWAWSSGNVATMVAVVQAKR